MNYVFHTKATRHVPTVSSRPSVVSNAMFSYPPCCGWYVIRESYQLSVLVIDAASCCHVSNSDRVGTLKHINKWDSICNPLHNVV